MAEVVVERTEKALNHKSKESLKGFAIAAGFGLYMLAGFYFTQYKPAHILDVQIEEAIAFAAGQGYVISEVVNDELKCPISWDAQGTSRIWLDQLGVEVVLEKDGKLQNFAICAEVGIKRPENDPFQQYKGEAFKEGFNLMLIQDI